MKRLIKFRGIDIDTGGFVSAELGEISAEINSEYLTFITDDVYTVVKDSIVQLVGYDKNGNEVYEGDSVQFGCIIVPAKLEQNFPNDAKLIEVGKS